MTSLLVFGLGYAGTAVANLAVANGWQVFATTSQPPPITPDGITRLSFDEAGAVLAQATHLLASAPPKQDGDPVLARHRAAIEAARDIRWIGYFSTTGVYGDRRGGWVDESSAPQPGSKRAVRRIAAEADWRATAAVASGGALDLIRLAGIYGPGRSAFDSLRAREARRILAPGHCFGRIHRDDIAGATFAAMRNPPSGTRVLNLTDDLPEESAVVTAYAADLLGVAIPEGVPLDQAWPTMSPMARSFWSDDRKVSGRMTQQALGYAWRYPTYREGLAAILAAESA
ncbi:SDR family NAD(P)-dependent oxidoreductase [Lichenicoccus sp.]|uniref:SDR family NAD(P)-dependent oxidoreductase n=1 Tax=Lichenicoccus sp. TaxID=2781899 RepID=UPI003D0997CC